MISFETCNTYCIEKFEIQKKFISSRLTDANKFKFGQYLNFILFYFRGIVEKFKFKKIKTSTKTTLMKKKIELKFIMPSTRY